MKTPAASTSQSSSKGRHGVFSPICGGACNDALVILGVPQREPENSSINQIVYGKETIYSV
jgi:hypothetical protein